MTGVGDSDTANTGCCELCGRRPAALTRHHLIPRMRHRTKRTRRLFSREEMRGNVLLLCRPCHKQIHALFTEKELAAHYTTRATLLAHPEISKFVDWIRDKPVDFNPRTDAFKRRRR